MSLYDNASLVMIPSGVKEDKLYSIKPTDGTGDFTFSRNADIEATRVNASGLIEKAKVNLLSYSEQFDNAYWNKTNFNGGTSPSVTANYGTSPIGTNTADRVQFPAQSGSEVSALQTPLGFTNPLMAGSIYVRTISGTCSNLVLRTGPAELVVPSFGTTWTRIENFCSSNGANEGLSIRNRPSTSGSGDAIDIMVWGAQLNYGTIAQDYVETTTTSVVEGLTADLPRLDYHNPDSSTPNSCPSLKLEPQRTNIHTNSEYYGTTNWVKLDATITDNDTTSPEGVVNASKLVESATTAPHRIYEIVNITSGQSYTQSVFVKEAGRRYFQIMFGSKLSGTDYANFDLQEGTITQEVGSVNATIESFGNGWYRCSATATASVTSSEAFYYHLADSGTATRTPSYTGDGTSGVYIYGAQVEAGSYPTSYIPTYGSSAQRNDDVCSKTGISSLIGQTEGTLFLEVNSGLHISELSNGTSSNRIVFYTDGNNYLRNLIRIGGSTSSNIQTSTTIEAGDKIALAYANNDCVIYKNGVQIGSDTSVVVPTTSKFNLGSDYNGSFTTDDSVNQALLFKTRLTNAELAVLTTL